jgi:4-hydroxythreonine-4-phosphate dehydrogenase
MGDPIIAICMGDPAGIGPEVTVKTLLDTAAYQYCRPFVVGDPKVMSAIGQVLRSSLEFRPIRDLAEARFSSPVIDVLCPSDLDVGNVRWGVLDPAMGHAAALCLRTAFGLAMDRRVHGIVSAPLNKEAFHRAGYPHRDELSYAAELTHSSETCIMGVMRSIWTVAVTEHIPFREILGAIRKDRVLWHILKMNDVLLRTGLDRPRIAIAALNVHGGEGGLFGREEIDEILPAIQAAQEFGIDAQGPVPADAVFVRALAGHSDGVVCMYHDQANIARKLQPRSESATIFVGLPVPCGTSAHGTAFDIAGQGIADPGSMQAALRYTAQLAASQGR